MSLTTIVMNWRMLCRGGLVLMVLNLPGCGKAPPGDEGAGSEKRVSVAPATEASGTLRSYLKSTPAPAPAVIQQPAGSEANAPRKDGRDEAEEARLYAKIEYDESEYKAIVENIRLRCGVTATELTVEVATLNEADGRVARYVPGGDSDTQGEIQMSLHFLSKLYSEVKDTVLRRAIIAIILGHEFWHAQQGVGQAYVVSGENDEVTKDQEQEADLYGLMLTYQAGYDVLDTALFKQALRQIDALVDLDKSNLQQRSKTAEEVIQKMRGLVYLQRAAVYLTATEDYATADDLYGALATIYPSTKNQNAIGYHGAEVYFNRGMNAYLRAADQLGIRGLPVSLARESDLTRLGPLLGREKTLGPNEDLKRARDFLNKAVEERPDKAEYHLQRLIVNLALRAAPDLTTLDLDFLEDYQPATGFSDHAALAKLCVAISDAERDSAAFLTTLRAAIKAHPDKPRVVALARAYLEPAEGHGAVGERLEDAVLPLLSGLPPADSLHYRQKYGPNSDPYIVSWPKNEVGRANGFQAVRINLGEKELALQSRSLDRSSAFLEDKFYISVDDGRLYPVAGGKQLVFQQRRDGTTALFLIDISISERP